MTGKNVKVENEEKVQKKDNQIKENLQKKRYISKRTTRKRNQGKTYIQEREQKMRMSKKKTDKNSHKEEKLSFFGQIHERKAKHERKTYKFVKHLQQKSSKKIF